MLFVLDPSMSFSLLCDPVTVTCDITLTPNPKFQNKIKIKEKENRNKKEIENNWSPPSSTLI